MIEPRFEVTTPAGKTVPLWVVQTSQKDIINDVSRSSIPFKEPEGNIRFTMGQEEELSLNGIATHDLFRQTDQYTDGEQGMAEWVQDVFALAGAQGEDLTMTDRLVSQDFDLYISDFNIQISYPRDQRINWDLQLIRGRGLTQYQETPPKVANPGQTATLDGIVLDNPESFSMGKSTDTSVSVLPDPNGNKGAEQNLITEEGSNRSFSIEFKSYRDIENQLRELRKMNEEYQFQTPFPGAIYQVSVDSVSVDRNTESPITYSVEMIQ